MAKNKYKLGTLTDEEKKNNTGSVNVTDITGEKFVLNIQDYVTFNGDVEDQFEGIEDGEKIDFKPSIVDADGNVFDISNLKDDVKDGKIKNIDVYIEATHSGKNYNFENYHSDSMANDKDSFLAPWQKPLLKNHDPWSEPMGRCRSAEIGTSIINAERDAITVCERVSDSDAIEKFMDGRYRTVSIGGSANNITCDVCGKSVYKDGEFKFCGHMPGRKYGDSRATWSFKDIRYRELSTVNHPADKYAQVTRIVVNPKDDGPEDSENSSQTNANQKPNLNNNENTQTGLGDTIDGILGKEGKKVPEDSGTGKETSSTNNNEHNQDSDKDKKIKDLEKNLEDIKKENKKLKDNISTLNTSVSDIKVEKETLEGQMSNIKNTNILISKNFRNSIVDRIIDREIMDCDSKTNIEDRRNELIGMSTSDLLKIVNGFKPTTKESQIDTYKKIYNSIATKLNKGQGIDDSNTNTNINNNNHYKGKTGKDLEDVMIKVFLK